MGRHVFDKNRKLAMTKNVKKTMHKNSIVILIAVVVFLGAGIFLLWGNGEERNEKTPLKKEGVGTETKNASNVSIVDGKQIIEIRVKGGYQPRKSVVKAGVPTVIRFVTNGTFDCSSAVTIPSKKISKSLPSTGTTDIELGTPDAGTLSGTCGMGMYSFEISFS